MRAAVLHTAGQPPAYAEHPDPAREAGRTLVRVTAAPVVPLDLLCASGTSYFGVPGTPYVPGVQGVGVVEESERFGPGTRVWFATSAGMAPGDGGLAERCVTADGDVVPIETTVADTHAAALGLSAVAAWMALTWRARLVEGETVLVLGAGGVVGESAIGLARALGAGRVVAVAREDTALDHARALGADAVVAMDADADRLTTALGDALPAGADVVVDPVWGAGATAAGRVLASGGRLVNIGSAAGADAVFSSAALRSRTASVLGYTNNAISPDQRESALRAVLGHAEAGRLDVTRQAVPLRDVELAWRRQAEGVGGRLVLEP